jgi:tRNA A-37 threonylcarbamoyl transferase component Bud32
MFIQRKKFKKRIYNIDYISNKKCFKKTYLDKIINNDAFSPKIKNIYDLVKDEYFNAIKLSSLVNYPKPIKYFKNCIWYEFLDLKCSFFDLIYKNKIKKKHILFVASEIAKIHNRNLVYGDFSPHNIYFDKNMKIYFIDSSYNIILEKKGDFYDDIVLFITSLRWGKSFLKIKEYFKFKKNNSFVSLFLKEYIKCSEKKIDLAKIKKKELEYYKNVGFSVLRNYL